MQGQKVCDREQEREIADREDQRLGTLNPKLKCLNSVGTGELLKVQRGERESQRRVSLAAKVGGPWRQGGP